MKFETAKTGQHLRAMALQEGSVDRMRALQALNYGYGTGSRATLANLLLATLGGQDSPEDTIDEKTGISEHNPTAVIVQVAEPLQNSANDSHFVVKDVSRKS